ncbi:MAG: tRNA (N(6)-L-threonylcarbamoyladenosine(37)-C(2))-methylthiotransferase MtaB [Treponema sp.]|jgi:threonylcarbamoyladenosine tRNA methylthiotransferase MtaB|nr:tRNA (N(6)-L-threonylcarbamoyladenosine(37)-C(2))-methylthiotransferase MtaB [Treponema sp.]
MTGISAIPESPPPPKPAASVYTLGCKLNQLESESIADAFRQAGFSIIPWNETFQAGDAPGEPDILIINTCTVTSHSEQKARRVIRKALRDFPRARLVVTGCYAQVDAAALESLGDEEGIAAGPGAEKRLFVIPGDFKDRILDLPRFLAVKTPPGGSSREPGALIESWALGASVTAGGDRAEGSFRFSPGGFSFHSRAFLKIQDGCDNRCAYCRVSIARGKSRSLGAAEVLAALRDLEARGFGEAVLTGVNLSQYKSAASGVSDLSALLEYLLEGTERIRIRLSSIEPGVFSPRFIRALSHERVRPHFHLSLQSGSDAVLKRMGRAYSAGEAMEGIEQIKSARDDPFLACDIIAGFPGETAGEFEKTREFCRLAGFAGIHAFPFSPRPGTAAWNFKDRVSEREAGQRVGSLGSLARCSRKEYVNRWMGREVEFVAEAERGKTPGFIPGITDNYLRLFVPLEGKEPPPPGSLLMCRIRPGREGESPGNGRFDAAADWLQGQRIQTHFLHKLCSFGPEVRRDL